MEDREETREEAIVVMQKWWGLQCNVVGLGSPGFRNLVDVRMWGEEDIKDFFLSSYLVSRVSTEIGKNEIDDPKGLLVLVFHNLVMLSLCTDRFAICGYYYYSKLII